LPSFPVCQNGTVIEQSATGRPGPLPHSVTHSSARNRSVADAPPAAQSIAKITKIRLVARWRIGPDGARAQRPSRPLIRSQTEHAGAIEPSTEDLASSHPTNSAEGSPQNGCGQRSPRLGSGRIAGRLGRPPSSVCPLAVEQASLRLAGDKSVHDQNLTLFPVRCMSYKINPDFASQRTETALGVIVSYRDH
jgi:hypothetical protein